MKHIGLKSKQYFKPIVAGTIAIGLMSGSAWAGGTSSGTETTTSNTGSGGTEQTPQASAPTSETPTGSQTAMHKSGVYSKTADEIIGMEVLQAQDEKKIGKVKNIVKDNSDNSLQAVIAVDQILGLIGGKKVTVPVDDLKLKNDKLLVDMPQEVLKQRAEYKEENYTPINQKDRPISEFAAMEFSPNQGGSTGSQNSGEKSSSGQSGLKY
jgi:sporulation protein YlmC with PRC-barrel domain